MGEHDDAPDDHAPTATVAGMDEELGVHRGAVRAIMEALADIQVATRRLRKLLENEEGEVVAKKRTMKSNGPGGRRATRQRELQEHIRRIKAELAAKRRFKA
jgi:crotonobetainyl-CoA:carnitine CoA-transferase CaiB-like acyl-CoA transferase